MIKNIKSISIIFIAVLLVFSSCKKTDYTLGDIKTPSALALTTAIAGQDATNPFGDGTGTVAIAATATNAISYKIDFGDGTSQMVSTGTINYKYSNPGTAEYTITVNAIGTGGSVSTISKIIKVFVAFEIPAQMVQDLTNGSSKVWVSDKETAGHFGVGPADAFAPIWYAADPNSRQPCAYDDEITFSKDASNTIFMALNNMGQSFSIGAASAFYGQTGGDNCYNISTTGTKRLTFMGATSGSTSSNSTQVQFTVPGDGLIIFGTGGTSYEILSLSATSLYIRNIGIDGNSWYQKLKVKP